MGAEAHDAAGFSESLIRLSVGLESEADLIADLEFEKTSRDRSAI
jgi:cystathionine beta-lyase/cystathionine gamma-synthase